MLSRSYILVGFADFYKVSPFGSVQIEHKRCGYESINFFTDLYKAKAFFLHRFGKVITLINNDRINRKAKLVEGRDSLQKTAC